MSETGLFIIEIDERFPRGQPAFTEHPEGSPVWVTFHVHPADRARVDEAINAIAAATGCINPKIQVLPKGGATA